MTLEERLAGLERELMHAKRLNGRFIVAGVSLAMVGTYVVLWNAAESKGQSQPPDASPNIATFTDLRIHDENGRLRSGLRAPGQDGPCLFLADEEGEVRAVLHVSRGGARLSLQNKTGGANGVLRVGQDVSELSLRDGGERLRLLLSVDKGTPSLSMYDDSSRKRVSLEVGKAGPALLLFDEKGSVIWSAPSKGLDNALPIAPRAVK